jgi:hypothetical protein
MMMVPMTESIILHYNYIELSPWHDDGVMATMVLLQVIMTRMVA